MQYPCQEEEGQEDGGCRKDAHYDRHSNVPVLPTRLDPTPAWDCYKVDRFCIALCVFLSFGLCIPVGSHTTMWTWKAETTIVLYCRFTTFSH